MERLGLNVDAICCWCGVDKYASMKLGGTVVRYIAVPWAGFVEDMCAPCEMKFVKLCEKEERDHDHEVQESQAR